jgi:predicted kinase
MLIILCGMPFSGKSTLVDEMFMIKPGEYNSHCLLRPADWMPEPLNNMDKEFIKDYRVTCWHMALDKTEKALLDFGSNKVIILDQGNHRYDDVRHLIYVAKENKHKIILIYVNTRMAICHDRSGSKWVGKEIWKSALHNIKGSLPKYKKACDDFVVVDNNGTIPDLRLIIPNIRSKCAKIPEPTAV